MQPAAPAPPASAPAPPASAPAPPASAPAPPASAPPASAPAPPAAISPLLRRSQKPSPTLNPKIIAISTHGVCDNPTVSIKIPVTVITAAKLGQSHRRMYMDKHKKFIGPILLNFFDRMIAQSVRDVSAIGTVITSMVDDGITCGDVEVHEKGSMMEDMFLFCGGVSMADSIYQLDTVDNSKTEVSELFNLEIVPEKYRPIVAGSSTKCNIRFPSGPSDDLLHALNDEHARLERKKTDWLQSQPQQDPDELNYEIATFNTALNSSIAHSNSTSRIVSRETKGKILLSKLLNDGITSGALRPGDVVVVFACRKHPSPPASGSAVSGPAVSSPPASGSAVSGPGGTKKRRNRIKRSRRKRKQQKSKYRK